jgi:hypothetical protein
MSDERDTAAFERRTKQAFDESVASLDGATRSRLTQARHRALEELGGKRRASWRWALAPAGSLAAAALVAWFVVGRAPPAVEAGVQATSLGDLEILLGEEDLEMLDVELEFYGWLEEQPEYADVDDNVG